MAIEAQTCAIGIRANRPNAIRCTLYAVLIMQNKPNLVRRRRIANEGKHFYTKGL